METTNHECYVSLEVAKLLKEAGFDWECSGHWVETNKNNEAALLALPSEPCLYDLSIVDVGNSSLGCICTIQDWNSAKDENGFQFYYSAPTLEVAQRWLREVKNISVYISSTRYSYYEYVIRKINQLNYSDNTILALTTGMFYTYEDAQESGIKNALEIILKKGE